MSNSKVNVDGDSRTLDVRERVGGLSDQQFLGVLMLTTIGETGDTLATLLDKYEHEIIRLQEANARLRNKNRNYRTGMKSLQRAHEATLHRERVAQDGYAQLKELVEQGGVCQVGYDGPYTPVRFNNEPAGQPVALPSDYGF